MKWSLACTVLLLLGGPGAARADEREALSRGEALYQARCALCHAVSTNHVGPRHQNVVGRKAGSVTDFVYSAALKNAPVVWTEANLDRWLANPEAVIPGQEMDVKVPLAEDRRLLILYLKAQTSTAAHATR